MKTPDFKQNKTFTDLLREQVKPLPETGWNNVGEDTPDTQHGVEFQGTWQNYSDTTVPARWYPNGRFCTYRNTSKW